MPNEYDYILDLSLRSDDALDYELNRLHNQDRLNDRVDDLLDYHNEQTQEY